jgi:hypothetical protein
MNQGNGHNPLTLVAWDMPSNRVIDSLNLNKGQQADKNVCDIEHILMARPFEGLGLDSWMLAALIDLTADASPHWLKAEIPADQKNIVKAFQSKGFEIRGILDDYFRDLQGVTHDMALMLRPLLNQDEDDF